MTNKKKPGAELSFSAACYAPTEFALDFFGSKMQREGIIVVDDYSYKTAPGIRKAVDEYCRKTELIKFEMQTGQAVLIRL